ncbi:MAG: Anaerobic nitric oxide reductase transcription regulator NorR [Planctomycetes bacterium]|nr:Anaerobic nitric oxide reductase transcription regulator NorR [Planctomycetota bacterium]
MTDSVEALRTENALYRRILDLGAVPADEIDRVLRSALELLMDLVSAERGWIEARDDSARATCSWSAGIGVDDEEVTAARKLISMGIVAETLATGRAVRTVSARQHPHYRDRPSVMMNAIDAVLCIPVGRDPVVGAVYLQGRRTPTPFSDDDERRALAFSRDIYPFLERAIHARRASREADRTQSIRTKLVVDGVVGRSAALARTLGEIALAAPLDVDLLLTGETGTGKSLLARTIVRNSRRAQGPFVEINCAAIPETLAESELFGSEQGAHSTAHRAAPGKIGAAEGGTLFLDEVGELPAPVQAKLLQFLQERTYYPLGSATPRRADVRVIAATNADLPAAVRDGRFRSDLYYRLSILPIRVASLAERREDVPDLVLAFAAEACRRHGFPAIEVARDALSAASDSDWPGNVRQLRSAVESAVIRCCGSGRATMTAADLFPQAAADPAAPARSQTWRESTDAFQRDLLQRRLQSFGGDVERAAASLDVARSHMYDLIRRFGLRNGSNGR